MITKEILEQWIADKDILYIYEFESAIRKKFMADSSSEYVIVIKDDCKKDFKYVMVYSMTEWFDIMAKGEIIFYRCHNLPSKYVHKEYVHLTPVWNPLNLREEVGAAYRNTVNLFKCSFDSNNYILAKQLLYNGLQYVNWGIQIMINRKIVHLNLPDLYFTDIILNPDTDYKYFEVTYLYELDKLFKEFLSYSENEYQEYKRKQIIQKNEDNNT